MNRAGMAMLIGATALTPLTAVAQDAVPRDSGQAAAFSAVHVERSREIHLDGPPEEVFPLFAPRGWQRWSPSAHGTEILHPRSGDAGAGAVMLTRHPDHEHPIVWVVADYAPAEGRIRYINVIPDFEAWELDIRCAAHPDGGTVALVIYRVTALSERANAMVTAFFEHDFADAIDGWATAINRALRAER